MDIWAIATKLFLGVILGAIIGLEREVNEKKPDGYHGKPSAIIGLRSFSFIALLGVVIGLLYSKFIVLSALIGGTFLILLIVHFILESKDVKGPGITTQLAMIFSLIIGILLAVDLFPVQIILALTIIVVLLLSQKALIKDVVEDIRKQEINAFVSFAMIAIVILPFLPNTSFAIADIPGINSLLQNFGVNVTKIAHVDIINPFRLWLIVALITGIDLIGYILEKTVGGKKGWLIASAVGGFVSSTATTQSLAQESKISRTVNHLVAAAILANMVSFFQIAFLIGALNAHFLAGILPVLSLMFVTSSILLLYFLNVKDTANLEEKKVIKGKPEKIINIGGALKFALLFLSISIISKIALEIFGKSGFLIATGIGSLIGMDAVMINTAQLAGHSIDFNLAALAFILANAVNLSGKSFYSFFQGKREFAIKFLISILIIISISLLSYIFL